MNTTRSGNGEFIPTKTMELVENKVSDQLVSVSVLLQDERSGLLSSNILSKEITMTQRSIVVDWLTAAANGFNLKYDTLYKGIIILDAALARMHVVPRRKLDLLGISSLALAATYEETYPPDLSDYVHAVDKAYTQEQIRAKQIEVFKLLGCSTSMPSEMDFARLLTAHSGSYGDVHSLMKNLLLLWSVEGSAYLPSVRATVCSHVAHTVTKSKDFINVFAVPEDVLNDASIELVKRVKNANTSSLKGYTRYDRDRKWLDHLPNVMAIKLDTANSDATNYITATFFKESLEIDLISPDVIPDDAPYLGKGTFGVVRAVDYNQHTFAVKTATYLVEEEAVVQSFMREISIMQSLNHEYVVPIHHITSDLKSFFIELGEGDLDTWISKEGPWDEEEQYIRAEQLLGALVYIHGCGVIHRDIKPRNIIVYRDEEGNIIYKISDFGVARGCDIALNTGAFTEGLGTLWFKPPEILLGQQLYGDRIDVWAMMCTLYQCSTGVIAFQGKDDRDQAVKIFTVLGKPNDRSWPGVTSLPEYPGLPYGIMQKPKTFWSRAGLSPLYISLLNTGLVSNPDKRPSAEELYSIVMSKEISY